MSETLCDLTLAEAAAALAAGEFSSQELTQACLARIERLQPRLNAFIHVRAEAALAEARERDEERAAGRTRSPLHGIPLAHKDVFDLAGQPVSVGSAVFQDRVATTDAACLARLREAGAVNLGRLNLHEACYGITGEVSTFGPVRNPWDLQRVTGGSSSGSAAAVAAGICFGSLGTDTGGSVRIPAAFCGIVGLKPTYGRISRRGLAPLAWSLDHIGPLTRSVRDAALLLEALAGYDASDPTSAPIPPAAWSSMLLAPNLQGIRLGLPRAHFWEQLDPEVERLVWEAVAQLERLGATVEEVSLPCLAWAVEAHALIIASEATASHLRWLRERGDRYHPSIRVRLAQGLFIPAVDYLQAQRARALARQEFADVLRRVEALLTPTCPLPAPRFDELEGLWSGQPPRAMRIPRCVGVLNLVGLPAISVPCGFTAAGLPVGLQVVGRAFDEATVLRVAHAYEQSQPWRSRRPTPLA